MAITLRYAGFKKRKKIKTSGKAAQGIVARLSGEFNTARQDENHNSQSKRIAAVCGTAG